MFDNYPTDANMDAYFKSLDQADQIQNDIDDAANNTLNAINAPKKADLMIIYDPTDGETVHNVTLPFPTYYQTTDPQFWSALNDDLQTAGLSSDQIKQLNQDIHEYELGDCLEALLPNAQIFSGQNRDDLDHQYFDYYTNQ